jgi:aspartate oxidase
LLEGLVFGASVGEVVAGHVADTTDMLALEGREEVLETIHRARYAIEQRLVMDRRHSNISASSSGSRTGTPNDKVSQEALSILAHLKSLMWENVGVVRTPAKLSNAVSELSAICDQADRLWMENGGSAGWEVIALRDASRAGLAVAESALANRVSGGAHYVVLDEEDYEEEEVGRRKDSDEEEDDVLVVARA